MSSNSNKLAEITTRVNSLIQSVDDRLTLMEDSFKVPAMLWSQSASPPDSSDPESKSSKSWALIAKDHVERGTYGLTDVHKGFTTVRGVTVYEDGDDSERLELNRDNSSSIVTFDGRGPLRLGVDYEITETGGIRFLIAVDGNKKVSIIHRLGTNLPETQYILDHHASTVRDAVEERVGGIIDEFTHDLLDAVTLKQRVVTTTSGARVYTHDDMGIAINVTDRSCRLYGFGGVSLVLGTDYNILPNGTIQLLYTPDGGDVLLIENQTRYENSEAQAIASLASSHADRAEAAASNVSEMMSYVDYDPTLKKVDVYNRSNHYGKLSLSDIEGLGQRIADASAPIGTTTIWNLGRNTIPTGYVPRDGQLLNRVDHPLFWSWIQSSGRVISESEWQSNPSKRAGYFSSGDASNTFRMQDANGAQEGSFKAVYERGSYGHGFEEGDTHGDAIRNITGSLPDVFKGYLGVLSGVFDVTTKDTSTGRAASSSGSNGYMDITIDASRQVPTTDTINGENRVITLVGVSIMKIASGVAEEISDYVKLPVLTGSNTWDGQQSFVSGFTVGEHSKIHVANMLKVPTSMGAQNFSVAEKKIMQSNIGGLGINQRWYNMLSLRTPNTVYRNETGQPIQVTVHWTSVGVSYFQVSVDGVDWVSTDVNNSANAPSSCNIIVPDGHYYKTSTTGVLTIWSELR